MKAIRVKFKFWRLLGLAAVPLVVALAPLAPEQDPTAAAASDGATIRVSGFTDPRNRAPLLDSSGNAPAGDFGTTNIVDDLLDTSKFGPGGVVPCTVELLPHVTSIAPGSLVDGAGNLAVDVFFAGLTDTTLTAPEAGELAAFVNAGGVLYISGNSGPNEGPSYNPLFTALGVTDSYDVNIESTGNFVQSSDPPDITPITNGPFGTVGPLMHTTFRIINPVATTGLATGSGSTQVILAEGSFDEGYLSMTGDPLYFNFFTGANDPDNQTYFLNLFALGCTPIIEVGIDIKPGSDPNSINPGSKGVIPVAILTTEDFDATAVDWTTVRFGPTGTEASPVHDLSDPLALADHQQDVDGDGDTDFVLHFRTQETSIASGDTEACLTGQTLGGVPIEGCDSVRTVR